MNQAVKNRDSIDQERSKSLFYLLSENIGKVIVGKDQQIKQLLTAWIAGGHVLIEDIPGTGKTMLVRALAKSTSVKFSRVQFTPDLLPTDIIGASIYNQKEQTFDFKPGPIFTTLLLADEINRATPRTQSALLECMSERQITVEGKTFKLDSLFCTIATQNPVDQLGTFPLPEAQMDRFMLRMSMGYPKKKDEISLVKNQNESHPIDGVKSVVTAEELIWLKNQVSNVLITDDIYRYAISLVDRTRNSDEVRLGCSPRASIALCRVAQALALFEGYDFVKPTHVQQMAIPVMAHRLVLRAESKMSGVSPEEVVERIIKHEPVPVNKM